MKKKLAQKHHRLLQLFRILEKKPKDKGRQIAIKIKFKEEREISLLRLSNYKDG